VSEIPTAIMTADSTMHMMVDYKDKPSMDLPYSGRYGAGASPLTAVPKTTHSLGNQV
jgi:hypothetical protein